jgi:hypothetical protein
MKKKSEYYMYIILQMMRIPMTLLHLKEITVITLLEQIKTICVSVNVFLTDKQSSEMIQIMYYTSPLDDKKII